MNFDTLKEHNKLHSADYIAVVGFSFHGKRLIKHAKEQNVVLIDIESLEELIKSHQKIPLPAVACKKYFPNQEK